MHPKTSKLVLLVAMMILTTGLAVVQAASPVAAAAVEPPTRLIGTATADGVSLRWNASAGAAGYNVYRNNTYVSTVSTTSFTETVNRGTYRYYVTAFDQGGANFSSRSAEVNVVVDQGSSGPGSPEPSDGAPPTPTGLNARSTRPRTATLVWRPSAGAGGYNVYRNGSYLATAPGNLFVDDVDPGTYRYTVTAFDPGAEHFSVHSNVASITVVDPPEHPDKPDAVVSLGDSFISGEAGRWKGNSTDFFGSRDSTDRAHRRRLGFSTYDDDRVYVGGTDGRYGCHRSDVAPIISAQIPGAVPINLACSGAVSSEVYKVNQSARGTQPIQTDALATAIETHDIELVVLSVGGNDIGFGDIIRSCLARFIGAQHVCAGSSQRQVDDRMQATMDGVDAAIDAIRETLEANGDRQHRIVLQSYPSVLPRGDDFRMSQSRISRLRGGCSFYDKDATWARDVFVPEFDAALADVAEANDIEFLSLRDAFDGKEVCARTVRQASENDRNKPEAHEWVRFVAEQQGVLEEALHPNMYGQQAMGRCLRLLWDAPGRDHHRCTNTGGGPQEMRLVSGRS